MDARTSRYHEVYARWQRDPEGFWREAAQDIDWIEPPKQVFDPNAGVYGRWFVGLSEVPCLEACELTAAGTAVDVTFERIRNGCTCSRSWIRYTATKP